MSIAFCKITCDLVRGLVRYDPIFLPEGAVAIVALSNASHFPPDSHLNIIPRAFLELAQSAYRKQHHKHFVSHHLCIENSHHRSPTSHV